MPKDQTTRTEFDTEAEALSFVDGLQLAINMLDSDHLSYDGPFVEGDMWIVEVDFVC
jgi:hypothetical protein